MSKIIYATVVGSGEFPIDMLRYDLCSPASEEDSNKIRQTISNFVDRWTVRIIKVQREKRNNNFTFGRWESFGCKVIEIDNKFAEIVN